MGVPVQSGDVLAGKYRVERVLGEGGMGVVVAARHLQLDQMVALKFLLPEAVANQEALSRFVREARNAVRLQSEHVARIIDVGTLESGAPYIVMEFLEGSDLAGVLAQQGALPIPVAVDFLLQACDAIAEAHALGIIHRDLKPQNLFMTRRRDGTSLVKVLDFGISKSVAGDDFTATRTQAVMGTPAYMSPEQMRSSKLVDARTDVWALGVILYELVVGKVPWEAETFTELCFKVAMDPLPPLPSMLQPGGFEAVVRCCLEKDPARRYPGVHALAAALLPFAPPHARPLVERIGRVLGGPAVAPMGRLPSVPGEPGTLREASGQQVTHVVRGSRSRRIAGITSAVVLVGIIATAVALGGGQRDGATDPPSPQFGGAATQPAPAQAPASPSPTSAAASAPTSAPSPAPAPASAPLPSSASSPVAAPVPPPSPASSPAADPALSTGPEPVPATVPPAEVEKAAEMEKTVRKKKPKRESASVPAGSVESPPAKSADKKPSPSPIPSPARSTEDKPAARRDPLSSPD